MKLINSIVCYRSVTPFGIGMVLSCGDNSPRTDAAICDCPAGEPPIAGRTVVIEATPTTIEPSAQGGTATGCMPGMQFLSGSCQLADLAFKKVTLMEFGFEKVTLNWFCAFQNNDLVPVTVAASVLRLKPTM